MDHRPDSSPRVDSSCRERDRRADAALVEAEERYRLALDAASLGTFRHDLDTGWVEIDARARAHFGVSASPVPFLELLGQIEPEDLPAVRAVMLHAHGSPGGEAIAVELRVRSLSGQVRWLALRVRSFEGAGPDGRSQRFTIATTRDVTESKGAEQALHALAADLERRVAERTAELARAARAKDEFLATMSHELRTPLNGILGLVEMLGEELYGPLLDKQRSAVGRIGESGRHLLSLINDILDVAKIESGTLELDMGPVGVADLCRGSMRLIQEPAHKKRIDVTLVLAAEVRRVVADERRLKQVLVNLLTNAVKFTPDGGKVGLEASVSPDGDELCFVVWDTGIGIAAEHLPQLFQPFVQLDSRLSRKHAGTGLGLSLVRRLVGLHGGTVGVESEPGVGSRFTVKLPMRRAPATVVPPAPPANENHGPCSHPTPSTLRRRLLIAEDDETNVTTLQDTLVARGYQVEVARNGREAIAMARELRPEVILMDVQMPVLDGLDAMRVIRSTPEVAGTPIVALTALAMPGDRERCLAAGADDYVTKPFSLRKLLGTLDQILARADAARTG